MVAVWPVDFSTQYNFLPITPINSFTPRKQNLIKFALNWIELSLFCFAEYFRPTGCMKGVFTRERQPKAAAHALRRRYTQLVI